MCGFTGALGGIPQDPDVEREVLQRMTAVLQPRGPDDVGYWLDLERRISLGHRRLSIVDLSAAGHQPMPSASSRYVIVYNGEVYNHNLLREELERSGRAPAWRGHSDTETVLAGFDAWGIEATVKRAIGMFAFAVWDRETRTLTLGRDRIGEKPLYYGWQGRGEDAVFVFGSELKALRAHPAFTSTIDRGALSMQLRHNYVPTPYSIYEGVSKVPPGALLMVSLDRREPRIVEYWSGVAAIDTSSRNCFEGTQEESIDALEQLLKNAVSQQMTADVPLGALLSGGIDSSTVVALMQAQSPRPVRTFSIGFHEDGYNEAEYAKAVAKHLGTEHTELYVTARQAMDVIAKLPLLFDEPFSDSSQIPTFLVAQLARQHVTVSLSGDAGDELFCGYTRYQMTANWWGKISRMPIPLRRLARRGLTSLPPKGWNGIVDILGGVVPRSLHQMNVGDKIHKGAAVLESESCDALYLKLVSHWDNPSSVVIGGAEPPTLLNGNTPALTGLDNTQRMMALDMLTYLPDDILVKVDRSAMGVALETRIPFLDHRVVEFAWRLPQSLKLRDGQTKWILRQVLYRYVPPELINRPKMGFGVPIGQWLRGPLRDWAEYLLDESRLRSEGFFHPQPIRRKWKEHLSGQRNWQYHLWDVLMFQAWLETNKH
jgi:asparagine synthase (glutamine-hydrolysing)